MTHGKNRFVALNVARTLFAGLMAAGTLVASNANAQTAPLPSEPTKVPAAYEKAYIPVGFDSNDQVEVTLEGRFSSSCWRPADIQVAVDHDKKEAYIGPAAYKYPQLLCAQMVLPFDRTVNLGLLQKGDYKLIQATDGKVLGTIPVKQATTDAPDDYLYAPVSQAYFKGGVGGGRLTIAGNYPNNCMMVDQVKIDVQPDVIVVQPIAKIEKRRDCKDGSFPFTNTTMLNFMKSGHYLLHVRSMNSKSINNLVDVK